MYNLLYLIGLNFYLLNVLKVFIRVLVTLLSTQANLRAFIGLNTYQRLLYLLELRYWVIRTEYFILFLLDSL
jgi:hypothetical protein